MSSGESKANNSFPGAWSWLVWGLSKAGVRYGHQDVRDREESGFYLVFFGRFYGIPECALASIDVRETVK